MVYSTALFLHVIGALGLSVAFGLEWMGLSRLRYAMTAEQARMWIAAFAILPRLYIPSAVAVLLSGLYMTATVWGWGVGWTVVALAAMVLLAVLGAALTGPRMAAIGRAIVAKDEAGPIVLSQRLRDPFLWASIQIRVAIVVGIVFLMTVKPDLRGALLTISVTAVLGLALTIPIWRRDHAIDSVAPSNG